ncbi:hypothetical protein [Herbidospora sp. NBRC 101105]|uniref:hypothetical protein n=1 Tax=Herbidospora sp. NBRC 101105 TaxID=3032195 RepID=UPI0024A5B8AB|nr:hypothetical protein [Herbidospora sp. NBRC 101105]GLX93444.1 hypothetical protein Hesp01_13940 [Herbidospora sp. NBRC 101105]
MIDTVLIDTVLFDVGGVLTVDPWQALWLTGGDGLADRLGLDHERVDAIGERLWPDYSLRVRDEADYWRDFGRALGREIPAEVVAAAEHSTLRSDPAAGRAVGLLAGHGVTVGFISDNTSFWFPKQMRLIGEVAEIRPDHVFLSYLLGVSKQTPGTGLFELAARTLDPSRTLVVDDRAHNIGRAASAGFRTRFHALGGDIGLLDAVRESAGI